MPPRPPLPPRDPTYDTSQNHYWRYHGLETLLSCKQPLTESVDEDLFIAVHQISELAFHQIILDLGRSIDAFAAALDDAPDGVIGSTAEACYFLPRVVRLYDVVNRTVPILGSLRGFSEFRTALGPSSGFQSFQFRQLEIMAGVGRRYWTGGTADAAGALHPAEIEFDRRYGAQVESWLAEYRDRSLRSLFETLRDRAPGAAPADRVRALQDHPAAREILRDLAAFDRVQLAFHRVHLQLAVQQLAMVGVEVGTGGTSFKDYLQRYEGEVAPLFAGLGAADPAA